MEIRNVFDKVIGERLLNLFDFEIYVKVLNYQKYYTGDEGELNSIGYFFNSLQNCALNIVWK